MARFQIRTDHPECEGFAVVADDTPDEVLSCHPTEVEAQAEVIALLEAELDDAEPEAPAPPPPPAAAVIIATNTATPLATSGTVTLAALPAPLPAPVEQTATGVPWRGVLALASARTQDGRVYVELGVRDGNLSLALQESAQHAFDPAGGTVCGLIARTVQIGRVTLGFGTLDESPAGLRAAELAANRFGVSVDLADMDGDITWECRAEGDPVIDPFFGDEITPCADELMVFPFARIAGATMTAIPAFEEAWIELSSVSPLGDDEWAAQVAAEAETLNTQREQERDARLTDRGFAIVASAVPVRPPSGWFETPEADAVTPLTWDPDGRVYGHLGAWDECHVGYDGVCVSPPRSPSGYAMFHTGTVEVETPAGDVARLRCGNVTFRTTHAGGVSAHAAAAHYENSGQTCAQMVARDGVLGIWVCGAMVPGLSDRDVREALAHPPSGDWRPVGQNDWELVNVLLVNTPGFMGPHRAQAVALTAGATVAPDGTVTPGRQTALIRLAYGYPQDRQAVLARRFAALEQRVTEMWEAGGRANVWDRLAGWVADPSSPSPAPGRPAAAAAGCGCGKQACAGTCAGHP